MKVIHCNVTRASQERDSMHMSAMLACLYELFYVYRIKCLLLTQSLITGLETMLSGCEPNSMLWYFAVVFSFVDIFLMYTLLQGEMQDAEVELW